ncbi:MAG: tRNA uridine-5-carboxymethylaminomethyl(34) synthesis GTPase MnmE [Alistipes sp.]
MLDQDIIVAPATALGGAIAVIRLSGNGAIECCDAVFVGRTRLADAPTHTLHYGRIADNGQIIDDVLAAVFRAPQSYTGEDSVEISIHGSRYIASEIIALLCRHGARPATAGEFSARAFANGKIDLSQAEAIADLIASDSRAAHAMASTQMRGGYSEALGRLRQRLMNAMMLLELELDFSEEDVEFADRTQLRTTLCDTDSLIGSLMLSFATGNAIRSGIRVVIAGEPNVGKSTLLNRLVNDDRAMVSEIAGTTRDTIEEDAVIDGIHFRFIDTAGLRTTDDRLEQMGIDRTQKAIDTARIVIRVVEPCAKAIEPMPLSKDCREIVVVNKTDLSAERNIDGAIYISARENIGIDDLRHALRSAVDTAGLYRGDVVVSNARHYEALARAHNAIARAMAGLDEGISSELVAEELRTATDAIGEITGEITSDEILQSVFSNFCVGK